MYIGSIGFFIIDPFEGPSNIFYFSKILGHFETLGFEIVRFSVKLEASMYFTHKFTCWMVKQTIDAPNLITIQTSKRVHIK